MTNNTCVCGHEKENHYHNGERTVCCRNCNTFTPAPTQIKASEPAEGEEIEQRWQFIEERSAEVDGWSDDLKAELGFTPAPTPAERCVCGSKDHADTDHCKICGLPPEGNVTHECPPGFLAPAQQPAEGEEPTDGELIAYAKFLGRNTREMEKGLCINCDYKYFAGDEECPRGCCFYPIDPFRDIRQQYKWENLKPTNQSKPTADLVSEDWQPIETVPQTGEHVLAANFDGFGFGLCGGKRQHSMDVVHWFDDGLYSSFYGADQTEPMNRYFTHWMPLPAQHKLQAQSPAAIIDEFVERVEKEMNRRKHQMPDNQFKDGYNNGLHHCWTILRSVAEDMKRK